MKTLTLEILFSELDITLDKHEGDKGDRWTEPTPASASILSIHWKGQDITDFILANYDEDYLVDEYLEHINMRAEEL